MKTGTKSILFLVGISLFSSLSAIGFRDMSFRDMSFRGKLARRNQNLGRGEQNRAGSSVSLSDQSRRSIMNEQRGVYRSPSLSNLKFSDLGKVNLSLELKNLNNRISMSRNKPLIQTMRFFNSNFGTEEVILLVNILANNYLGILSFEDCNITYEAGISLCSILKQAGLNLGMDPEDEANEINDFIEILNSGYPVEINLSGSN